MKCARTEGSIGLDRLATWEEVRCATSFSSSDGLEFVGLHNDLCEMNSDSSRLATSLREEVEWLMIVRKMRDCIGN